MQNNRLTTGNISLSKSNLIGRPRNNTLTKLSKPPRPIAKEARQSRKTYKSGVTYFDLEGGDCGKANQTASIHH